MSIYEMLRDSLREASDTLDSDMARYSFALYSGETPAVESDDGAE